MDDDIEAKLRDKVAESPKSLDWAKEEYRKAVETAENDALEELTEDEIREYGLWRVQSELNLSDRIGGGEEVELEIAAIGHSGLRTNWGPDDKDVVYSHGLIYGPLGDNGKNKAALAVMINDGTVQDLTDVQEKFYAENTLRATYQVRPAQDLDDHYVCWGFEGTELVEDDLDTLPSDRAQLREGLRRAVPEASLATLEKDLSRFDPETGYTYDFGADLRRIRGKVEDRFVDKDKKWARYTIMDQSLTEDDVVQTDWFDDSDDRNAPGLTVWADANYHMDYGRGTIGEFYGTIEEDADRDMAITMNLVGVVPIVPTPVDDGDDDAPEVDATEEAI